jgi:hypothetical protein
LETPAICICFLIMIYILLMVKSAMKVSRK